jgi:hypothetical protein
MVRSILPLFTAALLASAPVLAAELVPVPQFDSVELRGGAMSSLFQGRPSGFGSSRAARASPASMWSAIAG